MDDIYYAELGRDLRRRLPGVYIFVVLAGLLSLGVFYSIPMMHGASDFSKADGRIVAVARDPASGELEMTSEFTDADGVTHRDTQTDGYHYAPGDPKVGQSIEYLYKRSELTGDLHAFPRADRILQLVFGLPAAFVTLLAVATTWFLLRRRNYRRRLLREGRREVGQMHAIAQKSVTIPIGPAANTPIHQWRLEARYFEASLGGFVDAHSDWMPAPAPELRSDAPMPPIFVDPQRPERYWLPVGALGKQA